MLLELNKRAVTLSIVYCEWQHHLMQTLLTCSLSSASEVYSKASCGFLNAYKPCFLLRFTV